MVVNDNKLFISMLLGNVFTLRILDASAAKVPFNEFPPPNNLAKGVSCLIGLIHFSFPPKKEVTSITILP